MFFSAPYFESIGILPKG